MGKIKLNIFLVRHGEKTDDGRDLTSKGKKQAKLLAKRMNDYNIDRIISSPLPRCDKTAKIINGVLKKEVEYSDALREIPENANTSSLKNRKEKRALRKFLGKIKKMKGNVLIVGSGNVNRYLISLILKISYKKISYMGHYPTGLSHIVIYNNGFARVININDSGHLTEELRLGKGKKRPSWSI